MRYQVKVKTFRTIVYESISQLDAVCYAKRIDIAKVFVWDSIKKRILFRNFK